jgi:putative colanic acid biosynthesis UDP-glucose lipid carrier transferase
MDSPSSPGRCRRTAHAGGTLAGASSLGSIPVLTGTHPQLAVSENLLVGQGIRRGLVDLTRAVAPAVVSFASLYLIVTLRDQPFGPLYASLGAVSSALALLLLSPRHLGSPAQLTFDRGALILGVIGRWVALLSILLAVGFASQSTEVYSRIIITFWALVTPVLLVATDIGLHHLARRVHLAEPGRRRVVFAGCNEVSRQLAARLAQAPELKIDVAGFFDDRGADRLRIGGEPPLLGRLPDVAAYVKRNHVDMIFVALPVGHVKRVNDLLDELCDTTASVYYLPDIFVYDLIQSRSGEVLGMPVVSLCETPIYGHRGTVKRLTDVVLAGTALLALSPLMLVIAAAVKLTSPGPVIFRQRRYGLDGREIIIYKFRSMTVMEDGDHVEQARCNDPRVTRIGRLLRRTSLDELPQLINVLQGRMSLVGPRPHAVAHNEQYRRLIKGYMIRHKVPPGITGLAQVSGLRGETSRLEEMQARVACDIEYLRHWSLMLDLRILWYTGRLLLGKEKKAY